MNKNYGTRYTNDFREKTIARMMPPNNEEIKSISDDLGVSVQSLYKWRQKARVEGNATPGNGRVSARWSSEDKFLIVLETYALNQVELAEYSRKKGIYKEQIDAWRISCVGANTGELNQTKNFHKSSKTRKNVHLRLKEICG